MSKKSPRTKRSEAHLTIDRLRRLRKRLAAEGHEFLLVSGPANIRYLTGFTGSNGYLLVGDDEAVLYTDGRYDIQARRQTEGVEVVIFRDGFLPALIDELKKRRLKKLAFERNQITFAIYELLRDNAKGRKLEPVSGLVESLRMIKSPVEIRKIRQAVKLNSASFDRVCRIARPSWTEARFAAEVEFQMRALGADREAFDTIVASGERSALPHAEPSPHRISRNSLVVVDQGAILDGYTSDMTRMICFGRPDRPQRELVKAVREAQAAAVDSVKAGVKARTIDRVARGVLRKFKLDKTFPHSTGHGLGLEIHESPRLGQNDETRLAAGMVITIEPGAYLERVAGARIEDVVVVTANGCDVLTPTPRALRVL